MTILEALTWGEVKIKSTHHEKQCHCHNAKFDAQILLSFVLNKPKTFLCTHAEDELGDEVFDLYADLIIRRMHHEPIAHLIGNAGFYGRNFTINPHVLVPRPETELMVDMARDLTKPNTHLVDIGTGSGVIPITWHLETGRPALATDIDPQALATAQYNANKYKADVNFICGNLLKPALEHLPQVDHLIITANLPYLPHRRKRKMDPDVCLYEPEHALMAGIDGLDLYHALLDQIKEQRDKLPKETVLMIEIDPTQEQGAKALLQEYASGEIQLYKDYSKKPRLFVIHI